MSASKMDSCELVSHIKNIEKFRNDLDDLNKTWSQLTLLGQLGTTTTDMTKTKTNFNELTLELISQLAKKTIKKSVNEMRQVAQVVVDIVIRNLFERTADIGFLATDDDIVKYLKILPQLNENFIITNSQEDENKQRSARLAIKRESTKIKGRFKEYIAKYSVYDDIVLFDISGNIVCRFDEMIKLEKTEDDILETCRNTIEAFVETYRWHDFLPNQKKSLVYSYRVCDENGEVIGYLALVFKFEDEMSAVFRNLIKEDSKEVLMLLDKDGFVISSSDEYHIPLGVKFKTDSNLDYKIITFAGREYLSKTCKTNGYEGFFGLGWLGNIMIPISGAFQKEGANFEIDENILGAIMKNESLFEKELLEIPQKANKIQEELNRTVWNGNVKLGQSTNMAANFSRSILKEIRQTGEKTKTLFNISIANLNQTIIESLLNDVSFLASLSIEIMDRNLYERANDCRWWALTSTFRDALIKEEFEQAKSVLKYINSLYTVYTNIFIYNDKKEIVAVSNEKDQKLVGTKLTTSWSEQTLGLKTTSEYCVSQFEKTNLYGGNFTYIYNAPIKHPRSNVIVGGIGVVFDGASQFYGMLNDALLKDRNNETMFSVFVDKNTKKVISSTNQSYEIGETIDIDNCFFDLVNGQSISKIAMHKKKYYIVGAKCSMGYREYKSKNDPYKNDVIALVFVLGGLECEKKENNHQIDKYYNYGDFTGESIDVATFSIGTKWLGVKSKDIVEALDILLLESAISMDKEHHFKGTVAYKDHIVSVLDITPFVKNTKLKTKNNDIIIVKYQGSTGEHTIGILADSLGEILTIPTNKITKLESHLIGGGMLGESVVIPPASDSKEQLLTILNIEKICMIK